MSKFAILFGHTMKPLLHKALRTRLVCSAGKVGGEAGFVRWKVLVVLIGVRRRCG